MSVHTDHLPPGLAGRNCDAIAWADAHVGDFLLLRDPNARDRGPVFHIVDIVDDPNSFVVNLVDDQGVDVDSDREIRFHVSHTFDSAAWQIWRVFEVGGERVGPSNELPYQTCVPSVPPSISRTAEQVEMALATVCERIETEARNREWCDEYATFKLAIVQAIGWDPFPTAASRDVRIEVSFTLSGAPDATLYRTSSVLYNALRSFFEARASLHEVTVSNYNQTEGWNQP